MDSLQAIDLGVIALENVIVLLRRLFIYMLFFNDIKIPP